MTRPQADFKGDISAADVEVWKGLLKLGVNGNAIL